MDNLILERAHATSVTNEGTIRLTRNIVYTIINNDIAMAIIVVTELENNTLYEDFDNVTKRFILRETTPRLYFKDKNDDKVRPISIDVGNLNEGDFKYFAGKLKLYTMEYKKYDIFNGKLLGIGENKEII